MDLSHDVEHLREKLQEKEAEIAKLKQQLAELQKQKEDNAD